MKIFREYISRRQNRYSIRKFTIGTASILLGSLLIMGNNNEASASEESKLTKSEIDFNNDIKQFKDLEKEDTKEKDSISENLADDKVENSSNQKDFEEELNINTLQKNTQTEEQNKTNKELAEETINKKNTEDTKISEKGDPIQENNKTNKDVVENIVNNTTTESERKKYLNINKEEVEKPKEKEITKNKDIKHEEAKALYSPTKFQSRNAVNYSSRAADRKFKLSNQYVEIEEGNDIPTITVSGVKIGGRLFVPAGSSSTQNPDWIKIDIKSIRKTVTGRPVINDWKKGETSRDYMATIGWKANNSSETYVANIFIVVKRNMAISPEIPEVPIDTTAPEAPTVNRVTSEDSQVSGAAEAGSTVKVTFPGGETGTGTANEQGNYTIDIPAGVNLKGGEELVATATDGAGNESSEGKTTVVDITAPEAPTVNRVTSEDSQVSGAAEAGSTVKVTFPGGETATGTANEQGNYTVDIPADVNLKGGEELVVTATDGAGNESSEGKTTVVDTTAPEAPIVSEVTSKSIQIAGKAESHSTVTVTFPEGVIATGKVDETGNYVVEIPENVDLKGGEGLVVTATDEAGNKSPEVMVTVIDTTAPEAPTVNGVTSEDSQVSGTAEAGSTVKVTFPGGETATGTANEQGNYTVDIPADVNLKGGEELVVIATDEAGNKSPEAKTIVVDTTAPEAPTAEEVTSESTQISGRGEPGSTIKVTFPEGVTVTGTVDETGNYVVEIPADVNLKGGEELVVTATDEAGNESPEAKTIVVDTTAPEAPTVNRVTSEDSQVSGAAEAGSTVKVKFPGGETATGTANEQGNYTVDIPENVNLKGGEELVVTATDGAGNESSEGKTTVIDTTPPEIPIISEVTSESTQISGTGEPGSTIKVTFPEGVTVTGTVDETGNYVVEIPADVNLKGGEELVVTATDEAGNKSPEAKTIVVDTTAPEAPTAEEVTSESTQISGTGEPGSTIKVTFPEGVTVTGTVDETGNYVVEIPADVNLKGGEELVVTATDEAGNESPEAKTIVVDTTAPEVPIVSEVTSKSIQIAGKAEPHSMVTVTFPEGVTVTGTVDETGNYVVEIPENVNLKGGEELVVTATDEAGNESAEAKTTVVDTTAPEAPTVKDVTSDDTTISGTAEPGSTVTVTFPDGTTATGTADDEGNYTVEIPANVDLEGGETLNVTSTDKDGNVSDEATTTVTDTTAPEAPTVKDVTSDDTQISGTAEPGSTVTVTFPDGTTATGTTDDEGNYTVEIPANVNLEGGEELVVTSTDENSNIFKSILVSDNLNSEQNKDGKLPETGENEFYSSTLFGTLFAGIGTLLLFAKRQRKERK